MTRHERDAIDGAFVPVPSTSVHTVEIDGEAVLLDEAVNRLHHLNHTAALIWACLDGRASIGDIVADLSELLGVQYDDVLAGTIAVMRQLGDEGVLANVEPECPDSGS